MWCCSADTRYQGLVEAINAKLRPDESDIVEVDPAVSEFGRGRWV